MAMNIIPTALLLALSFMSPALADNPARSPPPEFYSERPVKGERIIRHADPGAMLMLCDPYGNVAARNGGEIQACSFAAKRIIHVPAIGSWGGYTAFEQRCAIIHERGHLIAYAKGKSWNHEGERFCKE